MSERLTDEEYRAWIDAGSPNELEGWAIILALRARVGQLEEELRLAQMHPYGAALKDAPQ
jgi:hypothetical protein